MKKLARLALAAVAVLAVGTLAVAGDLQVAQGKVTAVNGKMLTVAGEDGQTWTFEMTEGAKVVATRGTHKMEALAAAGKKPVVEEFVRENQYVIVKFFEENGTLYVKKLRVR
jgi:hypothetical protein